MSVNLLRHKTDLKIVTFDYETEDINLRFTKPWQLAYVQYQKSEGGIFNERDLKILWDDLNMSPEAAKISHFKEDEYLKEAKDPVEVLQELNQAFEWADIIAGHNILGFDIDVYQNACKRVGVPALPVHKKAFDTMPLFKAYRLERKFTPEMNFLSFQLKVADFYDRSIIKRGFATLKTAAETFNIDFDPNQLHNALYDVKVNAKVAEQVLWRFDITEDNIQGW